MNRMEQKKATALKILSSAKQLFKEQGYDETSTREIARHAGVATGTVFAHFSDKHQLTKTLFFMELESKLTENIVPTDKGAFVFFAEQTMLLYQFYDNDRALAQAFLKNALFEAEFFSQQLNAFIDQITHLLSFELPNASKEQKKTLATAWMGFYFQTLLTGICSVESSAAQWHQKLIQQCQLLLSMINQ